MEEGEIIGWTWWSTMLLISIFNFVLLFYIIRKYPTPPSDIQPRREQNIMRISAIIFTVVCAYRAILPRIDVPRTCWFNTFANWIIFGRTGACIAEICWAMQMGLFLRRLAICINTSRSSIHYERAGFIVIIIACIGEINSWTNLITENNFFAVIEQFLWMILFEITGIGIILLLKKYANDNAPKSYWIFGIIMIIIGLEQGFESFGLYLTEYLNDENNNKKYYGFVQGLNRLTECNTVTQNIIDWEDDAPWMTGYFSIAVWSSIWLYIAPFNLVTIYQPMLN